MANENNEIKLPEINDLRAKNYSSLRATVPVKTELGNLATQIKITENKDNGKHYVNFPGFGKRADGTVGDDCAGSDKQRIREAVKAAYEAVVGGDVDWGY